MSQICVLHGWSADRGNLKALGDFLSNRGPVVWLGEYLSTKDDVRIEDVARRMQVVVQDLITRGELSVPFDLIVHSTGGLVAREWLARFYPDGVGCPMKRLIMLAPANFGSKLATLGESVAGRIWTGWNQGFQSGTHMLEALELASPYQWELAQRDLFAPPGSGAVGPYGPDKVWPFTIVGTAGYRATFKQLANEHGSDGTVRASAANLQAVGLTIDFTKEPGDPKIDVWDWRAGEGFDFAYALVPDHDHGTITEPAKSDLLAKLINDALDCDSVVKYRAIVEAWDGISQASLDVGNQQLHQYMQLVVFVRDEVGRPVEDYFVEFFPVASKERPDLVAYLHHEVLEEVHVSGQASSRRCLYLDRTDLVEEFYKKQMKSAEITELRVRLSIAKTDNVTYFDERSVKNAGSVPVHNANEALRSVLEARLRHNRTHLIEIIVPRQASDSVFSLERSASG